MEATTFEFGFPKGLAGTRLQKEKSGSLPTGLLGLVMI